MTSGKWAGMGRQRGADLAPLGGKPEQRDEPQEGVMLGPWPVLSGS